MNLGRARNVQKLMPELLEGGELFHGQGIVQISGFFHFVWISKDLIKELLDLSGRGP